jgi:hypothetical protein
VVVGLTAAQVRRYRVRSQQLDRETGTLADTAVLDLGVQDTGPDGGRWALAVRGVDVQALEPSALVTVWSLRGAPHLYRRADLPLVAAAVAPFSEADAAKRVFDASRPLRAAGIPVLDALDAVAAAMRDVVREPLVKGEVSGRVAAALPAPYLRDCRACGATHLYEMPFRLAALRAGLELEAGTSPPVLRPIPGLVPAVEPTDRFDVVRACLRLLGPATHQHVAGYLDAPVADVRARWPADATPVDVEGGTRWWLDPGEGQREGPRAGRHEGPRDAPNGVRLLGPFDPFLQARDRSTLVADPSRVKTLWPTLGRPGAVLVDGDVAGTWRPRKSGAQLGVEVELWAAAPAAVRSGLEEQAERLAACRGSRLGRLDVSAS